VKELQNKEDKKVESLDFYIEDGKYVFTKEFHLKRGSCCGNKCRHCVFFPKYKKGNTTIFIDT
jgi:hypothetical protein